MHAYILFSNGQEVISKSFWMFPFSTVRTRYAQLLSILLTQKQPSWKPLEAALLPPPPVSPPPRPVQPGPTWVSIRGSWQRSKLVNTLLSSSVDFAI